MSMSDRFALSRPSHVHPSALCTVFKCVAGVVFLGSRLTTTCSRPVDERISNPIELPGGSCEEHQSMHAPTTFLGFDNFHSVIGRWCKLLSFLATRLVRRVRHFEFIHECDQPQQVWPTFGFLCLEPAAWCKRNVSNISPRGITLKPPEPYWMRGT